MTKELEELTVDRKFASESKLIQWLEYHQGQYESPEEYDSWLQTFFDEGNSISINGNPCTYLDCCELL